ncbi:hypothetical protein [Embleya sp. NPDC001921]
MKRTKLATVTVTCAAGTLAAVAALSTSAYAIPPEARSITIACQDSTGAVFPGVTSITGALTSSQSSPTLPQKMKANLPVGNPVPVPPNSAAIVIRIVQTSGGGSGVGTVFDFAGTTHPFWGPVPMVLGPLAVPAVIPAGTTARFKDTSGAPPSATNWSIKIRNPVPGTGNDIYCNGRQAPGSPDYSF